MCVHFLRTFYYIILKRGFSEEWIRRHDKNCSTIMWTSNLSKMLNFPWFTSLNERKSVGSVWWKIFVTIHVHLQKWTRDLFANVIKQEKYRLSWDSNSGNHPPEPNAVTTEPSSRQKKKRAEVFKRTVRAFILTEGSNIRLQRNVFEL